MPIAKKTLEQIAAILKLDVSKLEIAQKAEAETAIEVPTLHVFTPEELTTRDENNKQIGISEKKEEFIQAGKEIATKAIKSKFGITDASKDLDLVLGKVQEKISADDAAQTQITLLVKDKGELEKTVNKLQQKLQEKESLTSRIGKLPKNINLDVLSLDEHVELINKNLQFTNEGVKLDGAVLRNPTNQAALSEEEAIKYFYEQKRPALLATKQTPPKQGGRGGDDDNPPAGGNYKNLGEWRKSWEQRNPGKNSLSQDAQIELQGYLKDHPDMVMDDVE